MNPLSNTLGHRPKYLEDFLGYSYTDFEQFFIRSGSGDSFDNLEDVLQYSIFFDITADYKDF